MNNAETQTDTPKGSPEDRKTAVSIWVTLSSQLTTAALAFVAVESGIFTFILDKKILI